MTAPLPPRRTQVLLGDTRSLALVRQLQLWGWGRMFAERRPTPYPDEPWGFDNGAFGAWRRGDPFDPLRFSQRLAWSVGNCAPPLIAVTPDLVAGGAASLALSANWIQRLPEPWPWYLAVQDGMSPDQVEERIAPFAGLFLGGTNPFKATAGTWLDLARRHGKRFHYARAGTAYKLAHALEIGSDSLDTSFPLWDLRRLHRFADWHACGAPAPSLPWEEPAPGRLPRGP